MIDDPRILIATDASADANLVKRLLREEFGNLSASVEETRAVEDFESWRPEILILAFNSLEKAERYYLGLYRLGTLVHAHPHRTLILCNKEDLPRVYELCKQRYFDDYVLFWPLGHDAPRLRMAVHHAIRDLSAARDNGPAPREFAVQARRIAELEALLEASLSRGGERLAAADDSLRRAETDIGTALDGFSRSLSDGEHRHLVEIRDRAGLLREFDRLKADRIGQRLQSVSAAIRPAREWLNEFREDVAPHMEAAHDLGSLADRVQPMVLLVDDDEFQHTLVTRLLADEPLHVVCARSGTEGLAALRAHRPDLVLMDFHLPDIDGVEATRRLKAVERFSDIPVVMITGNSERSVVTESLNAGAVDFIVKPFDKNLLIEKLNRLLA
jgi:CheY-like chemotaxis protein